MRMKIRVNVSIVPYNDEFDCRALKLKTQSRQFYPTIKTLWNQRKPKQWLSLLFWKAESTEIITQKGIVKGERLLFPQPYLSRLILDIRIIVTAQLNFNSSAISPSHVRHPNHQGMLPYRPSKRYIMSRILHLG